MRRLYNGSINRKPAKTIIPKELREWMVELYTKDGWIEVASEDTQVLAQKNADDSRRLSGEVYRARKRQV